MQQLQRASPVLKRCKLSSASPEAAFGSVCMFLLVGGFGLSVQEEKNLCNYSEMI